LELHHYDLYRLGELGIMSEEMQEVIDNHTNITVIEWASSAQELLPSDRLIRITIEPMADEKTREITISSAVDVANVLDELGAEQC